jgi:nitrogen regulatory protein P-II 1
MKKIEAIVREEKLEAIKKGLEELGYYGMTITECGGRGRQKGIDLKWGNKDFCVEFLPKIKVEVVVLDEDLSSALHAIVKSARTGETGDGKIFVIPIENAIRIRTGDTGENAV